MPAKDHYLLRRHRRLRSWAIALSVLAVVAWLFELSIHRHASEDARGPAQTVHFCGVCAAFQAGSSATVRPVFVPRALPVFSGTDRPNVFTGALSRPPYHSRGPPRL